MLTTHKNFFSLMDKWITYNQWINPQQEQKGYNSSLAPGAS